MLHKRTRKSDITQLVLSAAQAQTKHARTMLQSIDEKLGASGVAQDEARAADIRQASLLARRELERQAAAHHEQVLRPSHRPGSAAPTR